MGMTAAACLALKGFGLCGGRWNWIWFGIGLMSPRVFYFLLRNHELGVL
jgi:hypothetical protein